MPKVKYEKPTIKKQEKMEFPLKIVNANSKTDITCRQCSSCHGCR
jgi:hypothetical protein